MNDTNINTDLLRHFAKATPLSSSDVFNLVEKKISLVTVKRQLGTLTKAGYLDQEGAGRSVKYTLSKKGQLLRPIDIDEYLAAAPDSRPINPRFQFDVFEQPNYGTRFLS